MKLDKIKKREILGSIFVCLFIIPLAAMYYTYSIFKIFAKISNILADNLQNFAELLTNSLRDLITKLIGDSENGS